ncbi:MAG: ribose-phosphate diphosphokinase [Gemmatimonadaceae bacterium]
MSNPLLVPMPGNDVACERLALLLDAECGRVAMRAFPDGETFLRLDCDPAGRDVAIVLTLRHPNDMALPLAFLADTIRDLGATRVGLVAPYLAYMRQDTRFHPGEAITSRTFAGFVSRTVDWLVTADPHLHRVAALTDIYTIPATAVHVASELGAWIATNVRSPLIVGPDAESRQWVDVVAAAAHAPSSVVTKIRRGDADVVESIPDLGAHRECTPVLVDDIISTGRTMLAAIDHLREQGVAPPACVGVHAVFATGAYAALEQSGAACIATTNTIPHPSNRIDVMPSIAAAVRSHLGLPPARARE